MFQVATDTATLCVFDIECLRHRRDDVGDWWSIPEAELEEVNCGNALILNLGVDGFYEVMVGSQPTADSQAFQLNVPSGRVFVGRGEELSGGGFEPDASWGGGEFLDLDAGVYMVWVARNSDRLEICFQKGGEGKNQRTELIRL